MSGGSKPAPPRWSPEVEPPVEIPRSEKERWPGTLAAKWHKAHPDCFTAMDFRRTETLPQYQLAEWAACVCWLDALSPA